MATTPSQSHARTFLARTPLAASLCAALALPAWSQTAPDAGRVLEQNRPNLTLPLPPRTTPRVVEPPVRPTVNMPEGMAVQVSEFRITGAASYPADVLAALVKPFTGRKLDINGLNEAAAAITRYYQAAGHLLTYAYLPAQRVADGVIEIAVLEGKLEGVQIVTAQDVRLRDEVIQAHTDPLTQQPPLLQADVERRMLLLNDIPGVTARAAFTPGANTGGAEMVVSVAEDEPLEFRADFSNHGSRSTGVFRAGMTLQLRDLFGWGDSTTVRALVSNKGSLVSGSLGTTVPLNGDGYRLGMNLSRLTYQLAGRFRDLGAVGSADSFNLDATYPLVRGPAANLNVKGNYEYKRLRDRAPRLTVPSGGLFPDSTKRSNAADLSLAFDARDGIFGGGATAGSLSVGVGKLLLLNADARAADEATGSGLNTGGEYRKAGVQLVRQQALFGPVSLYVRGSAQFASRNLDSSEKLGLGGPGGVRAYAPGELSVDQGGLATVELRHSTDYLGGNVMFALFADHGRGRINRQPLDLAGNGQKMSGAGLAVQWSGGDVALNASVAWRGGRIPTADGLDPRPRVYVQLVVSP